MKLPSNSGKRCSGRRSKKNTSDGRLPRLCRRERLSSNTDGSAHLGSARQDAATVSQLSPGSHFYHRRADSISQQEEIGSVCPVPSEEHHRGGGHLVSARIASSPHPTGGHDLGWRFDPYTADRAGLCATAQRSIARVSVSCVCPGVESCRTGMDEREALLVERDTQR